MQPTPSPIKYLNLSPAKTNKQPKKDNKEENKNVSNLHSIPNFSNKTMMKPITNASRRIWRISAFLVFRLSSTSILFWRKLKENLISKGWEVYFWKTLASTRISAWKSISAMKKIKKKSNTQLDKSNVQNLSNKYPQQKHRFSTVFLRCVMSMILIEEIAVLKSRNRMELWVSLILFGRNLKIWHFVKKNPDKEDQRKCPILLLLKLLLHLSTMKTLKNLTNNAKKKVATLMKQNRNKRAKIHKMLIPSTHSHPKSLKTNNPTSSLPKTHHHN